MLLTARSAYCPHPPFHLTCSTTETRAEAQVTESLSDRIAEAQRAEVIALPHRDAAGVQNHVALPG